MKWTRGHHSDDVEDRRGEGGRAQGAGPGLSLPLMLFSRFGFPGLLVGAALLYFGGGLSTGGGGGDPARAVVEPDEQIGGEREQVQFVSYVLDSVQNVWQQELGERYQRAKMVLFRGRTSSACGLGQAAMGPFYCPADRKVYLDLSFYEELRKRFGAAGDFALAYVVAHEVGHHVQNLLGTSDRVHRAAPGEQTGDGGLSVRLELQADCFAGVWGHAQQNATLEEGDLEEALRAAAAIGDDQLQRQSGGVVRPESWTHGSSAQRTRWFRTGFRQGTLAACDTFSANPL